MRKLLAVVLLLTSFVLAQTTKTETAAKTKKGKSTAATPIVVTPDAVQWGDAPAMLPAGVKMAVLSGNPTAPGPFVIRLKLPDGTRIMPHWHPTTENVTVLDGSFKVGMGNKFDESQAKTLPAKSYGSIPAHHNHYGMAQGNVELQVESTGPFKLVYVNPADDPSKKK